MVRCPSPIWMGIKAQAEESEASRSEGRGLRINPAYKIFDFQNPPRPPQPPQGPQGSLGTPGIKIWAGRAGGAQILIPGDPREPWGPHGAPGF